MHTSQLLQSIATWLESPNNEMICLSEDDPTCMNIVAEHCIWAAALLKTAAEQVELIEPVEEETVLTPENIEATANLAAVFDASEDEELKKMASVLDELLLTIAAPPHAMAQKKAERDERMETLRKLYQQPKETLDEYNKTSQHKAQLEKSPFMKEPEKKVKLLSSRSCPDHHGGMLARIPNSVNGYYCEIDKKRYNFDEGFVLEDGTKVYGGNVSEQTPGPTNMGYSIFDSREGRTNFHQ